MQQADIFHLKQTIEETEAMGDDPLGDLAKQLAQKLFEREIQLKNTRLDFASYFRRSVRHFRS